MYKEKTDKEMLEELDFMGQYEIYYRLYSLKKENANLKRKLTNLKKKYAQIK